MPDHETTPAQRPVRRRRTSTNPASTDPPLHHTTPYHMPPHTLRREELELRRLLLYDITTCRCGRSVLVERPGDSLTLPTDFCLLTTHYSLLTTHYSLLTTHYSLLTGQYLNHHACRTSPATNRASRNCKQLQLYKYWF
jgi:hypothetical protein